MPNVGSHLFESTTIPAFNLMVTKHSLSDLIQDVVMGGWTIYWVLDIQNAKT